MKQITSVEEGEEHGTTSGARSQGAIYRATGGAEPSALAGILADAPLTHWQARRITPLAIAEDAHQVVAICFGTTNFKKGSGSAHIIRPLFICGH